MSDDSEQERWTDEERELLAVDLASAGSALRKMFGPEHGGEAIKRIRAAVDPDRLRGGEVMQFVRHHDEERGCADDLIGGSLIDGDRVTFTVEYEDGYWWIECDGCGNVERLAPDRKPEPEGEQSDFNRWEIFKALREAYGCTVREVAERAGVSPSYVSEVENGNTSPSYRYVVKFADAFDLYRDWLLVRAGHLPSAVVRCRPSVQQVKEMMRAVGYLEPEPEGEEGHDSGDSRRQEVLRRLCRLREKVHPHVGYEHAADCFCKEGGFWDCEGYSEESGYRDDGVVNDWIEEAVEEKIARESAAPDTEGREDMSKCECGLAGPFLSHIPECPLSSARPEEAGGEDEEVREAIRRCLSPDKIGVWGRNEAEVMAILEEASRAGVNLYAQYDPDTGWFFDNLENADRPKEGEDDGE